MRIHASILVIFAAALAGCSSPAANVSQNVQPSPAVENTGTPSGAGAQSMAAAAEELIADLYKQHDAQKGPFFQTKDRARVDKYFTKPLADLIWNDAKTSEGQIGAIDFDPLYNAQDVEKKNFAVGKADLKDDTGTVPVTFSNFGTKQTVTFVMKRINDAWKIDDIRYSGGETLLKIFKANSGGSSTAASGEFEGKYTVGPTSCTVKPVKMAFEVRWAKGSGVVMFFYKDGNTFESEEDRSGGRNEFRFDDANYNSGMFVRTDGTTFTVKRAR